MSPEDKLERLRGVIDAHDRVLVAFSGGVDSTFLLKVAVDVLGDRCHAVTCVSETMARSERDDAVALGAELGLGDRHHVIDSNELERPGFAANPVDRCALCKTELMEIAAPLAGELGIDAIFLGTNTDDLGDYRPGIAAATERGAVAPMVEAGLDKRDVRELSQRLGLRTWDKPQLACLSSRFPYGTEITPARLERVDRFEDGLRRLGFRELRVRYHDAIARLELAEPELDRAMVPATRREIVELGRSLGFTYVALDMSGYESGSLNRGLVTLKRKHGRTA